MAVFHAYNAMESPGPPPLALKDEDGGPDGAVQVEESKVGDATTADNVSSAVAAASSGAQTRLRKAQLFLQVRFDTHILCTDTDRRTRTHASPHSHTYKTHTLTSLRELHTRAPQVATGLSFTHAPPFFSPIHPIYTPIRAPQVAAGTSIAVLSMSLMFGLSGYLSFRDDTKVDILENVAGPTGAAFRIVAALFLTIDIPMDFLVLRHSLLNIVDVRVKDLSTWTFTAVTVLFLGFVLMVAVLLQVRGAYWPAWKCV